MTKDSGGPTINQGGASKPTQERDREFGGIAGNVVEKGETPSTAARDRGEVSAADECAPIDLDTARDRAS